MKRIEDVFGRLDLLTEGELREALRVMDAAFCISGAAVDVLHACHEGGPLLDGDVPSKGGRDELLECGAVARVIVKGEEGFNACTYRGRELLNALTLINNSV